MMKLVIINTGVGNIGSIPNMLKRLGVSCVVTDSPEEVSNADCLILPGLGHFDAAVIRLKEKKLWGILDHKVRVEQTPILGICLGMQLFADSSEEGSKSGFGWIKGKVRKFCFKGEGENRLKVPHMGWNIVNPREDNSLFPLAADEQRFYFVHSYYFDNACTQDALCQTFYGFEFTSVVRRNNLIGVQFHPEKSHRFGLQFFENFLSFATSVVPC
jgi:glutamine amidotransferase